MHEWSESQQMIREAVRRFVEGEIAPHVEELEHGDLPPYDLLRKMYAAFGMDEMAGARFDKQIAAEKRGEAPAKKAPRADADADEDSALAARADQAAAGLIPIIELCRYCPGMVTALGVSTGLTASAILRKGTTEIINNQTEPWRVTLIDTGQDSMTGGRLRRVMRQLKDEEAFCMTYGDGVGNVDVAGLISGNPVGFLKR